MQGLRLAFILAALAAFCSPVHSSGSPLVADVTVHRTNQPVEMIGARGVRKSTAEFSATGASFIKLHFSEFVLPEGIAVQVSNADGSESYRYAARHKDDFTFDPAVGDDGRRAFSAMSITGDFVRVTLSGNLEAIDPARHALLIGYWMEGRPDMSPHVKGSPTPDSTCGQDERDDAACWAQGYPDAYDRTRPVGKVVTTTGIVCTAWRAGPQNRVFTAEHCIASQADVSAAEVWFNYEASTCGSGANNTVTKVAGETLLAVDETLDFALFSVSNFDKISGFGYLGLEVREGSLGEEIYIPQHGYGHPKQLAVSSDMNPSGRCQVDDVDHDGYGLGTDIGYYCDTVHSSSGAPVITAGTDRVIALHHLGGCFNSGTKMVRIWPMVSQHFGGQVPAGDTEPVLHNQPPRAAIAFACKGQRCTFSARGSSDADGRIVDFKWDLGDGKSARGERIYHTYSRPGEYTVSLVVRDDRSASASTSKSVQVGPEVKPPPVVIQPRG